MTLSLILLILISVLFFLVILQISKASELIGVLRGPEKTEQESYRANATLLTITGILFLILGTVTIFTYRGKFLPPSASEQGEWINQLIVVTFFFTFIVFIITHIILFWFVYKYQYNPNRRATFFADDTRLELVWTIIPSIVLTILVAMGLQKWFKIYQPAPTDAVVIEATGKQFMWTIRYPGMDNELGTRDFTLVNAQNELGINWNKKASHDDFIADEIVLPVNKPVLVQIGALDVLHSFYLPEFRMKLDAVPGIPTKFWFRPTITTDSMRVITGNKDFNYVLACAELCGNGHYNMRKVVRIVSEEQYNRWKKEQKPLYTGAAPVEVVAETKADTTKTTM